MKKLLAVLLVLCFACPALAETPGETAPETFLTLTRLDEMLQKLDDGVVIEKLFYTDGFGFSFSEFATDDPEEISLLLSALTAITLGPEAYEAVTDWYPQIVFYLSDESHYNVCFNMHNLEIGGMTHYTLYGDELFWQLVHARVQDAPAD